MDARRKEKERLTKDPAENFRCRNEQHAKQLGHNTKTGRIPCEGKENMLLYYKMLHCALRADCLAAQLPRTQTNE